MSDTPQTTIRTSFERVVQASAGLPQYESARALVCVEETFPGTMNPDEVQQVVGGQFVHAKAAVFEQLGINFQQDEGGIIREVFGDVATVAAGPPRGSAAPRVISSAPQAPSQAPQAPRQLHPASGPPQRTARPQAPQGQRQAKGPDANGMTDEDYWADLVENADNWEDMRQAKADGQSNPKGPDFKSLVHKEGRFTKGLWLSNAPDWFQG